MTEKYLARLILAKHPEIAGDDPNTDDNDIVNAYVLCRFRACLKSMTNSDCYTAVEKSETLEDFDREYLRFAPA